MPCARYNVGLWFYRHYPQLANIPCTPDTCMHIHKLPGISDISALFQFFLCFACHDLCHASWAAAVCTIPVEKLTVSLCLILLFLQ